MPFTPNVQQVQLFLQSLRAYPSVPHGVFPDDIPTDMVGALVKVRELSWHMITRQVILIPAAPCHGTDYYDTRIITKDNYSTGDPSMMTPDELVSNALSIIISAICDSLTIAPSLI
jgi:hypothetical protein